MESYVSLILGWIVYFFVHSLLAADSIKKYFKRQLGKNFSVYRVIYVLISTIGLWYLIRLNTSIHSELLFSNTISKYVGYVVMAIGISVIAQSFRKYSLSGFLGLANENSDLHVSGILKYVRHPIYLGTILIVSGYWFVRPDYPTLTSVTMILIYLVIGIRLEERKLVKAFGEAYLKYKREVPMIFPRLK
jgi:protein-S-isoprenylcysteine O-methyltransferase Ste14